MRMSLNLSNAMVCASEVLAQSHIVTDFFGESVEVSDRLVEHCLTHPYRARDRSCHRVDFCEQTIRETTHLIKPSLRPNAFPHIPVTAGNHND